MSYSENEYIKLNRKIVNWEWFTDINTAHLFIYCLLSANWKDGKFQGKIIKKGEFVTSLEKISGGTGLSIQQVRTSISKLEKTGEVTNKSFNKYRIIRVNNYCLYQGNQQTNNNQITNNQQTNNKQVTTIEEYIRSKEDKEVKNNNPHLSPLGENTEENKKSKSLSKKDIQVEINNIVDESELSQEVKDKLKEFVEYRRKSKFKFFTSTDYFKNGNLKDTIKCEKDYGSYAAIRCIENTLAQGYQGVFFDNAWKYAKEKQRKESFDADEFLRRFDE